MIAIVSRLICRFCRRPLFTRGPFWADDNGRIYCDASLGQHVPAEKEPESP